MLGPGGTAEPAVDDEAMGQIGWTQGNAYPTILEATFIAGAAVQQALHASHTAAQAASQAEMMQAHMLEAWGYSGAPDRNAGEGAAICRCGYSAPSRG